MTSGSRSLHRRRPSRWSLSRSLWQLSSWHLGRSQLLHRSSYPSPLLIRTRYISIPVPCLFSSILALYHLDSLSASDMGDPIAPRNSASRLAVVDGGSLVDLLLVVEVSHSLTPPPSFSYPDASTPPRRPLYDVVLPVCCTLQPSFCATCPCKAPVYPITVFTVRPSSCFLDEVSSRKSISDSTSYRRRARLLSTSSPKEGHFTQPARYL